MLLTPHLNQEELKAAFKKIDEEARKKKIAFTREEALKDDLYKKEEP